MANMNIKRKGDDNTAEVSPSDDYDRSPSLYLNSDQCEALGIKGMPAPGAVFTLKVQATVRRASVTTDDKNKEPEMSVDMLMQDIEITNAPAKSASEMLYDND